MIFLAPKTVYNTGAETFMLCQIILFGLNILLYAREHAFDVKLTISKSHTSVCLLEYLYGF